MYHFTKPARPVTKVYIHCSASDNPDHDAVAVMDAWHRENGWSGVGYHLFCRKSGLCEPGRSLEKTPAAQGGHNRGSIALCLHGLDVDKFTDAQKDWLIDVCCQINEAYGGAVTFHGHCEVANKTCPVIDYRSILKLDEAGRLGVTRGAGSAAIVDYGDLRELEEAEAGTFTSITLRMGEQSPFVRELQVQLKALGYHAGELDGHFGRLTRDAVLAFQADNHLIEDGIAGRATFEALTDAQNRAMGEKRAAKSVTRLAADGSRIAQASVAQGVIGTTLSLGGTVAVIEESTGMVTRLSKSVGTFEGVFASMGPWLGGAVVLGGVLIVLQAVKAGRARRDDHRSGRTL